MDLFSYERICNNITVKRKVVLLLIMLLVLVSALVLLNIQNIRKIKVKCLLEKANYCAKSTDCVVVAYGCPFACYNLINKTYNTSLIESEVNKFNAKGISCIYDCNRAPKENEIGCINKKCVDLRHN